MTSYTEFTGAPMLIVEEGSMPAEELVLFLHVLRMQEQITLRGHPYQPDAIIIEFPEE